MRRVPGRHRPHRAARRLNTVKDARAHRAGTPVTPGGNRYGLVMPGLVMPGMFVCCIS